LAWVFYWKLQARPTGSSGGQFCEYGKHSNLDRKMKRYTKFLKQTWWLWLTYTIITALLIYFVSPVFFVVIPMMIVNFFYFALVRYNEDGDFIGA
jgi:uncharacterized membrane protein